MDRHEFVNGIIIPTVYFLVSEYYLFQKERRSLFKYEHGSVKAKLTPLVIKLFLFSHPKLAVFFTKEKYYNFPFKLIKRWMNLISVSYWRNLKLFRSTVNFEGAEWMILQYPLLQSSFKFVFSHLSPWHVLPVLVSVIV